MTCVAANKWCWRAIGAFFPLFFGPMGGYSLVMGVL